VNIRTPPPLLRRHKKPKVAQKAVDIPTMLNGKGASFPLENIMKIRPDAPVPSPNGANGTTGASATARPTPAETGKAQNSPAAQIITGEASATVALSSAASTMMDGLNEATADFDAEKVSRVTRSLADGSYKVNAEVIADKLIANAKELLTNAQQ
jgi:negative regulator of flagellin synthesis FlgM